MWVRISRPSENFSINGGSASGWSRSVDTDSVTYTGGSLGVGANHTFNVTVQTGTSTASAQSWVVQLSDDSGGGGATICSGSTGVSIGGDTTAPLISNIAAANVGTTSATITWTTNEASTSVVRYGTTQSYGSTATGASGVTSHSVGLSGLSPSTTYHFQVESADGAGNTATSGNNSFTTSATSSSLLISNISAGSITASSATITWTTNLAASSRVDYGTTSSYGSSLSDGAQVTSHSLTLTGLSASTTYHYRVRSTDSTGHTVQSGDNTFLTASGGTSDDGDGDSGDSGGGGGSSDGGGGGGTPPAGGTPRPSTGSSGGGGGSSGGGGGGGGGSETVTASGDTSPPVVTVATDFRRPYATAPAVVGGATDNRSVVRVEYTLTGGRTWLPATILRGRGTTRATYSAALGALADDNYRVRVRAIDASGNIGYSPFYTLVIDQAPPLVGTSLYAVGAQAVPESTLALATVIAGLDQQITVSAVGGPVTIDIIARPAGGGEDEQVFSLVKNEETGLWLGTLSFKQIGSYELVARAVDGANNVTERTLRRISAVRGSQVTHEDAPVVGARVTVFAYQPLRRAFDPWNGALFGQANPQVTDDDGAFQYFLPPGTYYVVVQGLGYRTAQTPIFHLDHNTPLQLIIPLTEQFVLNLGPLSVALPPRRLPHTVPLAVHSGVIREAGLATPTAVGQPLPELPVVGPSGESLLTAAVPRPALVTLITEWSPQTAEQLDNLEEVARQAPGQVLAVLLQGTATQAALLRDRGHYEQVPIVADPRGEIARSLGIDTAPANLLIDENGTIVDVRHAPRSWQELLGALHEIKSK